MGSLEQSGQAIPTLSTPSFFDYCGVQVVRAMLCIRLSFMLGVEGFRQKLPAELVLVPNSI